jgi:predicted permease
MIRRLFHFATRTSRERVTELDDEVRFHLDARTDELASRGLTRDAARRQAQREFGDLDEARRYIHRIDTRTESASRRRRLMDEFKQDVRLAIRRLRKTPVFTLTAIVTLAFGIGANAAIFSIVYGVLLRPLPFPEPDQLFAIYSANRTAGQLRGSVSPVDFDDWRAGRRLLADLGGYFYADGSTGVDLTGRGAPRRLAAVFVTPGFFETIGLAPAEGRLPREDELVRGGADRNVMLSHAFWVAEFGASRDVVGSALTLNGRPYEVLGVLPASLRFPTDDAQVYVPYSTIPDSGIPRLRQVRVLNVIGRASAGAGADGVRAEMNAITRRLADQYPEDRAWDSATVLPLAEVIAGPVRRPLLVLMGAVACVLLIACVNLAGLQLARAAGRRREIGICVALGARRGRVVRQLLTESLVLAAAGGLAGLAVAKGSLAALLALGARELPRAMEVGLDATVVAFAVAATIVSGLLFGLLPALRMSSGDLRQTLDAGTRHTTGLEGQRLRSGLVVAEVALAMMLVVAAGLMARSFAALLHEDAGFQPDRLVAVQFTIDPARHAGPPAPPPQPGAPPAPARQSPWTLVYKAMIDQVRTLPGIVSAAAVKDPPFRGNGERSGFRLPGRPVPAGQDSPTATAIHVSDGYFRTIGARMVDGREFAETDRTGAPFVIVVNEAFARQFFPGQRTVGQKVIAGRDIAIEIIGVVNDIRQVAMAEPAQPTMYLHNMQNGRVKTTIVARTSGEPLAMADAIRRAVWSIDPAQAITAVFTFDESVGRALARPRLVTVLLVAFGAVGLGLGVVGIYGVLVFVLQQRRREIGVRLALGARPADVRNMFVRRGLSLAAAGVGIGLLGALAISRGVASVLYGVAPTDPATLAGVAATLLLAAALASWLPAVRAARVDPVETLRAD